jgi:rhamnogalacturonan acetylesterase
MSNYGQLGMLHFMRIKGLVRLKQTGALLAASCWFLGPALIAADRSNLPTIFVVADSTSAYSQDWAVGWGDMIPAYFDLTRINLLNCARGGLTARTLHTKKDWDKILVKIHLGDFVLLQFNNKSDNPISADSNPGALPGLGDESQVVEMPNGRKETVHTFGWYLRLYISDTKSKGATPIVMSGTVRNLWYRNMLKVEANSYNAWSAETARVERVPFIDLAKLVANEYQVLGQTGVNRFFPIDSSRTNRAGAELNASLVVAGIKDMVDFPLVDYLSPKGRAVVAGSVRQKPAGAEGQKLPTKGATGN